MLYGTLPFDAGVPTTDGRLAGARVLVAHGANDHVIPEDLLARTWEYLHGGSGAALTAHRDDGGHGLTRGALDVLRRWVPECLRG